MNGIDYIFLEFDEIVGRKLNSDLIIELGTEITMEFDFLCNLNLVT